MKDFRIIAVGDAHHPFANKKSLRSVVDIIEEKNPTHIIQIGDLHDMFSFGRFPRSYNNIHPKDELQEGIFDARKMWLDFRKAAPRAICFQLKGNHDERPVKLVLDKVPALETAVRIGLKDCFEFPGVKTMDAERDELIIHDIIFMHGFRSRLGDHARHNGMPTVCGHSHQGGVAYIRLGEKTIWELNCGFIADANSEPLSYTRQRRISNWTQGVGYIDKYGPMFIPFSN